MKMMIPWPMTQAVLQDVCDENILNLLPTRCLPKMFNWVGTYGMIFVLKTLHTIGYFFFKTFQTSYSVHHVTYKPNLTNSVWKCWINK